MKNTGKRLIAVLLAVVLCFTNIPEALFTGGLGLIGSLLAGTGSEASWSISNYYMNESDNYYVEETDDFTLKYQVEFHTSETLEAGAVTIRIPAALFTDRDGNLKLPDDIGVPKATVKEDGSITTKSSSSTPFNYYIEYDQSGVPYLVFFNYKTIDAGSNSTFQVLYKNIDIMDVKDGTTWSLTPVATVTTEKEADEGTETETDTRSEEGTETETDTGSEEGSETEEPTQTVTETQTGQEMSGLVDTGVTLTGVTKKPYTATGKAYTPALYTKTQVKSFIDGSLPTEYENNFDDYVYVVWTVTVKGSATQPWNLSSLDVASIDGTETGTSVVGYKTKTSGYSMSSDGAVSESENRTINLTFYVVTAYPKDSVTEGTVVENTITETLTPVDGIDAAQSAESTASCTYQNYEWTYRGDTIGISKTPNSKTYSAWLDVYENNQDTGTDSGSFAFVTKTDCYGYGYTHNIGSDTINTAAAQGTLLGDYIEGTYYEVVTVDDAVYAYPNGLSTDGVLLGDGDYYFSSVTVTTTDKGYDVWEDQTASPETMDIEGVSQGITVYAMYQGSDTWTYAGEVEWNSSGTMTYTFTSAQIAKKPYRVKVVHDTINYYTSTSINVSICLNYDSPNITALQQTYETNGEELTTLQLENISGVSGENFTADGSQGYFQNDTIQGSNYSEEGLADLTTELYGTLLQRDNGYVTLTRLTKHASSTKSASVTNDPDNSRVLVDYYLTAYEGYYVSDSSTVTQLKEQGVSLPERTEVVFYDLLPYGMKINASAGFTAGTLTSITSSSWQTSSNTWDTSDVTVTVSDSDIIDDWNGTGRTLVKIHVTYTGDDPDIYSAGVWLEGFGVSFQAYYDWDNIGNVNTEYNIAAYMPADNQELYAGTGEAYAEGTVPASYSDYSPFDGQDLNGDGVLDDDLLNVLYARALSTGDVATASSNYIVKQVRADADTFASYGSEAVVGYEDGYTYEISVKNPSNLDMSGIVIYDCLEDYSPDVWTGTFAGIVTTPLESAGAAPVVYYNTSRDAVISEDGVSGSSAPSEVLTAENGWYEASVFLQSHTLSEVQAVAVDISKAADGSDFVLGAEDSVSFLIHMTAPDEVSASGYVYTYNSPSFYSVTSEAESTVSGSPVQVTLGTTGMLEVEKEFSGAVPEDFEDAEFTFIIKREGTALANQKYELYEYDSASGEWVASGVISATDASGEFTLTAGQKAVFSDLVDYDEVTVEEEENLYWEVQTLDSTDITAESRTMTFTNTYRPPVYFQKTTAVTANVKDMDAYTFTFRITVLDSEGKETPYVNSEYAYVQKVVTDGSSPTITGYGTTDENGYVTLRAGEIIAFFPGAVGTEYVITEISTTYTDPDTGVAATTVLTAGENSWVSDAWICKANSVSGTATLYGASSSITNYYWYRNLIFTKFLEDQDAEDCTSTFTFRVTDSQGNPVTGNRWVLLDSSGNEKKDENDIVIEGTLSADGTFSLTGAGTDCRVRIEGLLAEETYTITETDYDAALYEPVNGGTAEVTMPFYTAQKTASVTNQYLLRDLSVSKLVITSDETQAAAAADTEFTFTLTKDGAAVAGAAYTISDEDPAQEHVTGTDGTFILKSGQTATFSDIGYEDDTYVITETPNASYPQVYPDAAGDAAVTLTDDGGSIQFINGTEGLLAIEKKLVGMDAVGEAFAAAVKADNTAEVLSADSAGTIGTAGTYAVSVTIRVYDTNGNAVTDGDYTAIFITAGSVSTKTFAGTLTTTLAPYDGIYLSGVPEGYTVKVTESSEWELILLEVSDSTAAQIGAEEIISYTDALSAQTTAGGNNASVTLTNYIASASAESEIYKKMTADSEEVETGAVITFRVEQYDGTGWNAVSGIRYLPMDDVGPTDSVQKTGSDGLITLEKTANGYPSIRFPDDVVYVNYYEEMSVGDLRIVEVTSGTDESWGILAGYDSGYYEGGPAISMPEADTFVNANDTNQLLKVAKVLDTGEEDGSSGSSTAEFTFQLTHVLSASTLPITSSNQILDSEAGSGIYYLVYDSETDEMVGEGYTDTDGRFTIQAGQYAVLYTPDDTVWEIHEVLTAGYELESVTATGSTASVPDGEMKAIVQEEKELTELVNTAFAVYSADDNSLTFYKAYTVPAVGDTYNGKTVTAVYTGIETDSYTADLTDLTNTSTSTVPWAKYLTAITSVSVANEIGPVSTAYWFAGMTSCTKMSLSLLDTSDVTDMTGMFYGCTLLTSLDLSSFDTSSVDTSGSPDGFTDMLTGCTGLQTVIAPAYLSGAVTLPTITGAGWADENGSTCTVMTKGLDTTMTYTLQVATVAFAVYSADDNSLRFYREEESKIPTAGDTYNNLIVTAVYTGIEEMDHSGANGNNNIPWKDYRTNVKTVVFEDWIYPVSTANWFYYFSSATKIDLAKLNTSNVTSMDYMFANCQTIETLDVSGFDTSKVTTMAYMFQSCRALTSLDLSGFDTSAVESMAFMFNYASALTSLDLSTFKTGSVTTMANMFYGCTKLASLNLSGFNTAKVTTMANMFYNCSSLTSLDLSDFDTSAVTTMSYMFRGCETLATLEISQFDTTNVYNVNAMFRNCYVLTTKMTLSYSGNSLNCSNAFYNCSTKNGAVFTLYYTEDSQANATSMRQTGTSTGANVKMYLKS